MKKTDCAYAAGIIDGEGCIYIRKQSHKSRNGIVVRERAYPQLEVQVANTNEWLLQWLKFAWGGSIRMKRDRPKPNWNTCWTWVIVSRQALSFLLDIYPYLHLKRPQAELAIRFQQAKVRTGHRLTNGHRVLEEAQCILMKKLKKVGG